MVTDILKKLNFYPYIFAICPLLFLINNNGVSFSENGLFLCTIIILITILSWIIVNTKLKNSSKTSLIIFLSIMIFYQGWQGLPLLSAIILFVIGSGLCILLIYLVLKTRRDLSSFNYFFNIVSLLLISFNLVGIINNELRLNFYKSLIIDQDKKTDIQIAENIENHNKITINTPDIYYIVPDEYAGVKTLKKYFNYDNSAFYRFLNEKGFVIPDKSTSNYPMTFVSLRSSLDMNYNKVFTGTQYSELIKNTIDSSSLLFTYKVFNNNLTKILKTKNYKYVHILNNTHQINSLNKSFANNNIDKTINCASYKTFNSIFYSNTALRYFLRGNMYHSLRQDVLCSFSNLEKISKSEEGPKFVFVHVLLPHPPYLFDENGKPTYVSLGASFDKRKKAYLNQVVFTNKMLKRSIDSILANKKPSIIIIQSDHGVRMLNKEVDDTYYDNFIAIYLPNKEFRSIIYPEITPVNIFRVIFNNYFHMNYPLLEDKKGGEIKQGETIQAK
ncbi:MAG: hypothetical protein A2287_00785 [Candidatus Melainabacteria bacterium RIFOXYA12_FULL_32_12]|nr:MAG: hypothetical protein A2287_00785 [Candidatus Melainabacteria bacterium RIFOXYA12_FULL_32_12]